MSIGTQTTYWNFIQRHGISIPVIQRDYAQGREGKEVLRSKLLGSIKDSLDNEKALVLDFVYGMRDAEGRINPLDGQQRLTTLWLLHWYLLLKSNNKDDKKKYLDILSKFTYETRISSRKFCECLCQENNFNSLRNSSKDSSDIRKEIEKQTWFMGEWKQDPTVKAMLNMLGGTNGIQEIFTKNHQKYWSKLIGANCPITFYYLSLDGEIAQTPDDIYIKMNARGEHLTDFENFKADLIKYVRDDKDKDNWKSIGGNQDNPELHLSQLIDSEWTDIFWSQLSDDEKKPITNNEEREVPNVDQQFFAFLNRYFLNCIFSDTDKNIEDNNTYPFYQYAYGKGGEADTELKYTDFCLYENAGVITPDNFKALTQIFKTIGGNTIKINEHSKPYWDVDKSTFSIFPCYEKNDKENSKKTKTEKRALKSITQKERVAFYGVCCYLENCNNNNNNNNFCEVSFKEWMHFVWNMARNSDVETVDSMIKVIRKINEIKEHTHNIIDHLENQQSVNKPTTYFDRQWEEEIWKATIRSNNNNETKKLLDNAEGIFHGSIRFLLDSNALLGITRAENLIYDKNGNYKKDWFLNILPYMNKDLFVIADANVDKKLTFYDKTKDVEKIINHDNDIINAVQEYLKNTSEEINSIPNDSWVYPLIKIKDEKNSLFDYSNAKLIRKYFHWDSKTPTGIYLYKTSQWKKDQCILLQSNKDEIEINKNLINRNNFIVGKINDGYKLAMNEKDEHLIEDKDKHLGRSIILKKGSEILYCGVNCYWKNGNQINYQ